MCLVCDVSAGAVLSDLPPIWWTPKRAKLVYNTTIGGKA
jgi:hypothetical protein